MTGIVIDTSAIIAILRNEPERDRFVAAILADMGIEIVAHDTALAHLARDAFLRFGKSRHPARLNFGDCASYAFARAHNLPLLFKGDDFNQTDIVAAFT